MIKRFSKKAALAAAITGLFVGGPVYAGGDNRVSMTDMKEALYSLIIESRKNGDEIEAIEARMANVEPSVKITEANTKAVAAIVSRLNQLGVPSTTGESDALDDVISSYVDENVAVLPKAAIGVR